MEDKIQAYAKNIKLILCDMDGTLLNQAKTVSTKNLELIKKARKQDKLFSICTGRIPTMMQFYIELLELETPFVAANGAIITEPNTGKIISDVPMDEDEVIELMDFLKFNHMDYCALTLKECYFSNNSIRIQRFQQYNQIVKDKGLKEITLTYFDDNHNCIKGKKLYKILVYELVPGQMKMTEEFLKGFKNTGCTSSEPNLLDISEKRVNKGYGLSLLMNYLNLTRNHVCAIGDYFNDISMLKVSGFPIAMENACKEVKDNAVYITKTNEEDGIAWFLKKYIIR